MATPQLLSRSSSMPGSINTPSSRASDISDAEDDEITPLMETFDETHPHHLVSSHHALMNFLKAQVGTGILAMPVAIMNAGLWVGTIGLLVLGAISGYCQYQLVLISHVLRQRYGLGPLDYGTVAEISCKFGPGLLFKKLDKQMKFAVQICLLITQFGFCCVYLLFISANVKQIIQHYTNWMAPVQVYMVVFFLVILPFVYIRSLKHLAPFSIAANICSVVGLGIIIVYVVQDLPSIDIYPAFNSTSTLPLYFGTAVFAFEGISLVLPIENTMKNPEHFLGFSGVLVTGIVITTCLYTALGFFGFLRYGTQARVITLNLPKDDILFIIVRLIYCFALFISYLIQFYVPAYILYPPFRRFFTGRCSRKLSYFSLRTLLAVLIFVLSALVPYLELLISLIGALAGAALAFIFPPLFDILTSWPTDGVFSRKWKFNFVKNCLIISLGLVGFVTGTVVSLMQIITAIRLHGIHI